MFHAAGWTFPWSITFSFSTQVCTLHSLSMTVSDLIYCQVTLRSVEYSKIWKHFLGSRVTHYCGAPTVQVRYIMQGPLERRRIHQC
jgi:hypothetical protein